MSEDTFKNRIAQKKDDFEKAFTAYLTKQYSRDHTLNHATLYSLQGGKRVRPLLSLLLGDILNADLNELMHASFALEMVHGYSLVHDDLPCMDDDDMRRNRRTTHKEFSEGLAVLVGDTLQSDAFFLLSDDEFIKDPKKTRLYLRHLSYAIGSKGMAFGQFLDTSKRTIEHVSDLSLIHKNKTGALMASSCVFAGIAANLDSHALNTLKTLGEHLGMAFQLIDDLLDCDDASLEPNYLKFYSKDEVLQKAYDETNGAKEKLSLLAQNSSKEKELFLFFISDLLRRLL